MITDKDVKKLKQTFTTKDDLKGFATKDDMASLKSELKDDIFNLEQKLIDTTEKLRYEQKSGTDKILTVLDRYMKNTEAYKQETTMLNHKVNRHEKWIGKLAKKVNVKLEY